MSHITIKTIHAHEVINAQGNPTIQIELFFSNNHHITTTVPCDDSKKIDPRINELHDQDPKRFNGLGLQKATSFINNQIAPRLINHLPYKQKDFDTWLLHIDGTENKSKLGINTMAALSQIMARAAAYIQGIPLFYYINKIYNTYESQSQVPIERIPTPLYTLINGGKYGGELDFEDFYFIPSSTIPFSKSFLLAIEIFQEIEDICKSKNLDYRFSLHGAYLLKNITNLEVLDIIGDILEQKNIKIGLEAFYGINCNAEHYYSNNRYNIKDIGGATKTEEYYKWIQKISEKYSLLALEDVFQKNDWDNWRKLYAQISEQTYLIGNNIAARLIEEGRLEEIAKEKAATTISVEPYIYGTITEVIKKIHHIRSQNLSISVLPSAEETCDDFLADFAVGVQAEFIQFGGFLHSECISKYNRLWHIDRFEMKQKKQKTESNNTN